MQSADQGPQGPPSGAKRRQASGNRAIRGNFNRMEQVFGTTSVLTRSDGGQPTGTLPPVSDTRPFSEVDVLNKVGILTVIAIAFGAASFAFPVSLGVAFVCIFVALGLGIWTIFRPRVARVTARIYAAVEGVALGVISRYFSAQSHGIVPLAIILTGALFMGVLIAYRTGLVRVTNRFISMTIVAGFGLLAVMLGVLLGISIPGVGNNGTLFLVFGVIYTIVAIMDLFVDFELVRRSAQAGVPAEAEWYAAFSIFLAVVMLYLGLLRILGAGRR
jgi:uncharacterized YccA/Bax inhibitor family protein